MVYLFETLQSVLCQIRIRTLFYHWLSIAESRHNVRKSGMIRALFWGFLGLSLGLYSITLTQQKLGSGPDA